jgi:nicotinamide-nucleotide amidase
MIAEIIAVGSEMLTPHRTDTNSLYLTAELNDLGVQVAFKTIVGDSLTRLTYAIRVALARTDVLLLSGGLGPTEDDLTREAVAAALDLEIHRDNDLIAALYKRFAKRKIPMSPNNEKQADLIAGAIVLPNKNGSAPGQLLDVVHDGHRKLVILLPGPPKELKPLFESECRNRLASVLPPRHIARRFLRIALLPESIVDAQCAPIYRQYTDVETTILAHSGEIQLHLLSAKPSLHEAQARVDELAEKLENLLGESVFSAQGLPLEEVVVLLLGMKELTLATAESATGGLLAERITNIPNSSTAFRGGVVVYSNELKTLFADVPPELIERHGAVSPETTRALAEGIRKRTGASLGLGITGLAGPAGGVGPDARRPLGRIYIAIADGRQTTCTELDLPGDRERIRWWAAQHALELLRRKLL